MPPAYMILLAVFSAHLALPCAAVSGQRIPLVFLEAMDEIQENFDILDGHDESVEGLEVDVESKENKIISNSQEGMEEEELRIAHSELRNKSLSSEEDFKIREQIKENSGAVPSEIIAKDEEKLEQHLPRKRKTHPGFSLNFEGREKMTSKSQNLIKSEVTLEAEELDNGKSHPGFRANLLREGKQLRRPNFLQDVVRHDTDKPWRGSFGERIAEFQRSGGPTRRKNHDRLEEARVKILIQDPGEATPQQQDDNEEYRFKQSRNIVLADPEDWSQQYGIHRQNSPGKETTLRTDPNRAKILIQEPGSFRPSRTIQSSRSNFKGRKSHPGFGRPSPSSTNKRPLTTDNRLRYQASIESEKAKIKANRQNSAIQKKPTSTRGQQKIINEPLKQFLQQEKLLKSGKKSKQYSTDVGKGKPNKDAHPIVKVSIDNQKEKSKGNKGQSGIENVAVHTRGLEKIIKSPIQQLQEQHRLSKPNKKKTHFPIAAREVIFTKVHNHIAKGGTNKNEKTKSSIIGKPLEKNYRNVDNNEIAKTVLKKQILDSDEYSVASDDRFQRSLINTFPFKTNSLSKHQGRSHVSNGLNTNDINTNGHTSDVHTANGHTPTGHTSSVHTAHGRTPSGHTSSVHTANGHTPTSHTSSVNTANGHTPTSHTSSAHTAHGHTPTGHTSGVHTPIGHTSGVDTTHGHTTTDDTTGVDTTRGHTTGEHTTHGHTNTGHTTGVHSINGHTPSVHTPHGLIPTDHSHTPNEPTPTGHTSNSHTPHSHTPTSHNSNGHTNHGLTSNDHSPGGGQHSRTLVPSQTFEVIDSRQGSDSPASFADVASAQPDRDGQRCIDKVIMQEETEFDEYVECHHSYDKRCHTTYVTNFEPTQEEECDENYRKRCFIEYSTSAYNQTVEVCHEPLVKDCDLIGPEVCSTQYESECWTKLEEHDVEDDVPECTTVKEQKCEDVTIGYTSQQKCTEWPIQKCSLTKANVVKTSPITKCEKVPKQICAPAGCGFVPGPKVCYEKKEIVISDRPEESCSLEPQTSCKHVTKLVPKLEPKEECLDVPKELCSRSARNPRKIRKPIVKKWCYTPTEESGLA